MVGGPRSEGPSSREPALEREAVAATNEPASPRTALNGASTICAGSESGLSPSLVIDGRCGAGVHHGVANVMWTCRERWPRSVAWMRVVHEWRTPCRAPFGV